MSKKKNGVCHLCGQKGKLSFEHMPPEKAFNAQNVPITRYNYDSSGQRTNERVFNGGLGAYTLCENCNTMTGELYAVEYIKWAKRFYPSISNYDVTNIPSIVHSTYPMQSLYAPYLIYDIFPLKFLKQVVTCFVSLREEQFSQNNQDLRQFVLEPNNQALPSRFRFFMNLYKPAQTSPTALRRNKLFSKMTVHIQSKTISPIHSISYDEIAHPPFQLIMTTDGSQFKTATEITHFKDYPFDERVKIGILSLRICDSKFHREQS